MSSSKTCSGPSSRSSSVPHNNQSEAKLVVTFNMHGKPIGDNKKKMNRRALSLAKVTFSVAYDNWNEIPNVKKEDLWQSLLERFEISIYHKGSVMGQVCDQWKTWKKNIRKNYLGKNREEILMLRGKPPEKEGIPLTSWNIFIDREATPEKLAQRARNKANRAKKRDVHMLGSKSYSQVTEEWKERTEGTEEEGLDPNRVNLFLHARKIRKTGEFHPNVADYAGKISEIRSIQDENTRADIDSDALTVVLGKDKRGNTRGVGTKVSRTKIKAIRPLVSELQQVKKDVQQQKDVIEKQMSLIEKQSERIGKLESTFSSKMDFLINLIQGQSQKQSHFPSSTSNQMYSTQIPSSIPSQKVYYHIKDVENKKNIAMGEIVDVTPGTIVHCRAMVAMEAKVSVLGVYSGMENEKVYLGEQGGADTISDFVGICLVWSLNLLEKIV